MKKRYIPVILSLMIMIAGISLLGLSVVHIQTANAISSEVLPVMVFVHSNKQTAVRQYSIPKHGSLMGTLVIPAINKTLPIYQGTETAQLDRGVGHFEGSVLPGQKDNAVLAGHRDSVFSQLGKLKIGDTLVVRTADGIFTYKIFRFRIVKADDRTVIVPTPTAVLTLSTCYPFRYFGNAPDRYIVSANLINTASLP